MPVYAYKCRDCGAPHEAHQEFSDAPLTVCPVCGGALRKQYGSIGVTFTGSGFYRNDSRAGAESAAGSTGGSGDGAKGETTSAGKGDSAPSTTATKTDGASKPAAAPSATTGSSSS